jgi:hypothetical protein
MAIDDFASCMGNRVTADVDEIKKLGESGWKQLIDWWKAIPDWFKYYLTWVAGANKERLGKAITAIFGAEAWEVVTILLGAVAWGVLIDSAIECEGQL